MLFTEESYSAPEVKLLKLRECAVTFRECNSARNIYAFWNQHVVNAQWFDSERECLVLFCLNARRSLKQFSLVSIGSVDTVFVHPREVFRVAIVAAASSIIVAHNHPSGDPSPSETDIKVTRELIRAGLLLKIEVADHVVIGNPGVNHPKGYASLRELGYFYQP